MFIIKKFIKKRLTPTLSSLLVFYYKGQFYDTLKVSQKHIKQELKFSFKPTTHSASNAADYSRPSPGSGPVQAAALPDPNPWEHGRFTGRKLVLLTSSC